MKVALRAMELQDLDLMYQVENLQEEWVHTDTTAPLSRFALEQYILSAPHDLYADRQLRLTIVADGTPAGFVDLTDFHPQHLRAQVGIVVDPSLRRHGVGTEALRQLVHMATHVLHLHTLHATVSSTNLPSMHLFASIGFAPLCTLPAWLRTTDGWDDAVLMHLPLRA